MSKVPQASYLLDFLQKINQPELEPHFDKAVQFYRGRYRVLRTISEKFFGKKSLLTVSFEKLASVIRAVEIPQEHYYLFWIAKLYFLLPLPPGWTQTRTTMENLEFKIQDVKTAFNPAIAYVLFLKNYYLSDPSNLAEMRALAKENRAHITHFYANEKGVPFVRQFHLAKDLRRLKPRSSSLFLNSKISEIPEPVFLQIESLKKKNEREKRELFDKERPDDPRILPENPPRLHASTCDKKVTQASKFRLQKTGLALSSTLRSFKMQNKFPAFEAKAESTPNENADPFFHANMAHELQFRDDMAKIRKMRRSLLEKNVNIPAKKLFYSLCTPWMPKPSVENLPRAGQTLVSFRN